MASGAPARGPEPGGGECEGTCRPVFSQLCSSGAEHLNGRMFQQIWRDAARGQLNAVEQEDMDLLEQLGSVLGEI